MYLHGFTCKANPLLFRQPASEQAFLCTSPTFSKSAARNDDSFPYLIQPIVMVAVTLLFGRLTAGIAKITSQVIRVLTRYEIEWSLWTTNNSSQTAIVQCDKTFGRTSTSGHPGHRTSPPYSHWDKDIVEAWRRLSVGVRGFQTSPVQLGCVTPVDLAFWRPGELLHRKSDEPVVTPVAPRRARSRPVRVPLHELGYKGVADRPSICEGSYGGESDARAVHLKKSA